ncbi:nucleolin [Vigna unguiculata]|uniref:nucleolin n=1 Tax=Vigna unguiculata TaxID=3917 RepID=UPI0010167D29|nr:nucleolin [Vigna unguiculata]
MGLRNSKQNAAKGEAVPAKVIPKVVAKFEELTKRRNAESTPSKKELLKHDDEVDANSRSSPENESGRKVSSSQKIQKPKEEMVAQVPAAEKLSRVAPVPNSEGKIMEKNHPNKDYTEQVNRDMMVVAELKSEEEKSAKLERETRKEKDEDDDSDDEDGVLCPGSPSFRIYCAEESEKIKESECEY